MTLNANVAKDPVCGMEVDTGTTFRTARHDNQIYYFCSPGCQSAFQAEPERYVALDYKPSMLGAMAGRVRALFRGKPA